MRILVGVDLEGSYEPALHLIARLGFPGPSVTLIQAAPPALTMLPAFPMDPTAVASIEQTFEDGGKAALARATEIANSLGLSTDCHFCFGGAAESLNDYSERLKADLVAVRTIHHGAWQSEMMGSVARGVLIGGHASLLVVKDEPETGEPFDACFAVDGSELTSAYLERLMAMAPKGIKTIHVVSAWGLGSKGQELLHHALGDFAELTAKLEHAAQRSVDMAREQLEAAGFATKGHVVAGHPNPVLHNTMKMTGAHLLIVGSHGHGFAERLFVGGITLHQIVSEPYPVLVLRG
jgi:nucleotide-binding universal stress UspA family protein